MPPRPADGRNPVKTRDQAATSKKNVALSKVRQEAEWKKRLLRDGPKIDKKLDTLTRAAKGIAEALKKGEDRKKAIEDFGDMLLGVLKEMKTYTEVPVPGKPPEIPKNTIAFGSMLPVLIAAAAWWKLVRKAR